MNNKYNKTVKKVGEGKYGNYGCRVAIVGGKKVLRGLKRVEVVGISEVGLPKIDVGLTKSYIKSCIRRVGVVGVVFAAVFLAAWATMPANGAEAAM